MKRLGAVVIGLNEGERLRRCLESVLSKVEHAVYVDSGSVDDSVRIARELGAQVVELDMSVPFTAARARNTGLEQLLAGNPQLELVQFIDGDCELFSGWLEHAAELLDTRPELAVVCGRLRERRPEASVYNRLCDMEWSRGDGEVEYCGGIAMMRVRALREVGGFNPRLIAGEEPELCVRFRQRGYAIWRSSHDMAWHDAAMYRFSQWWKRTMRAGYAYAEVSRLHEGEPYAIWDKDTRSNWLWGGVVPASIALTAPLPPISFLLASSYGALFWRVYRYQVRRGEDTRLAALYAASIVVGKLPMALGQARFTFRRLFRGQTQLHHKKPTPA